MAFNGTEGSPITQLKAQAMTAAFRLLSLNQINSVFIGREHIEALLAQSGSMGIRIYYGIDLLDLKPILVSSDQNEQDDMSLIIDNGKKCPPYCGPLLNLLNG